MKVLQRFLAIVLILQFSVGPNLAQGFDQIAPFQQNSVSGISNLKAVGQTPDGTEMTFNMDYTYDGLGGPTAKLLILIEKRGEKGVSGWFGCDPSVITRGSGVVSVRVKYFNDEFGVPPQFTSDRGRVLFINNSGVNILSSTPFIKTIKWGSANARPADKPAPTPVMLSQGDSAQARKIAQERQLAQQQAEAEIRAREEARKKAEAEASMRRQAEERALAEAKASEEARLEAEAMAKRLMEEKRLAESKAKQEAEARELALIKA
jgi:hypothetical protein